MSLTGALLLGAAVTVLAPVGMIAWLRAVEVVLARVPYRLQRRLRPWGWAAPPLAMVAIFLLWPMAKTVVASAQVSGTGAWTLSNYRYLVDGDEVRSALVNNAWWLLGLTGVTLVIGLLVAVLADAVRWESLAKSVIVMPVAISTVAGAVIWRFVYDYQPPGFPQTGALNAVTTKLGADPNAWLLEQPLNKAMLLVVGIWMSTGIAAVVLSAALKGLPPELSEAARIDGAGGWGVFRHIVLPQLLPSIVTVATLLGITALKAFDVVYVMTNGNYDTDVLANLMYRELFLGTQQGHAAALALLIVVLTLPIIAANIWVTRTERR